MATTTGTMTSTADTNWLLEQAMATQTFNATLTTNGKYLDRDIDIKINVNSGKNEVVLPTIPTIKPVIADAGEEGDHVLKVSPTTVKPTEGTYIAIKTGDLSTSATVTAQISQDGFLTTTDTKAEELDIKVVASDTAYIPLAGTSASADAKYGTLANYFNKQDTNENADVVIEPNYTIPAAGYIGEADHVVSNPTYWAVKQGLVSGWNKAQTDAPNGVKQITGVTAVESGGAIHLKEGWYEESYITLADIIPDILDLDPVNGSILYGYQAFDEKGNRLVGSIRTYDTKDEAGFTHSTDKNKYYISGTSGASSFGVIPAHSYVDQQLSIKAGAVKSVVISGSVKPTIAAVTTASATGAKNITTSASETAPESAYYVAVQSNAGKGDTASEVNITEGWLEGGLRQDAQEGAITLEASGVTYAPVAAGAVEVSGGDLAIDSITNEIKTTGITEGLSVAATDYKIDATAAVAVSRAAAAISAKTGYIEKANVDNATAIAAASKTDGASANTVYLKKAVISSTGVEATNPTVTTSFDSGSIVVADEQDAAHPFEIAISTSASKGSVETSYTASAGYTPAMVGAKSGAVEIDATINAPEIKKYVKKGAVSASTSVSNQKDEFLSVTENADAADITITAPVTVTEGYVQTGDAPSGVAAHYVVKKTSLAGSDNATVGATKASGSSVFASADGVVLHENTEEGKTYKAITSKTTINLNVTSTGKATVAGQSSGWVDGSATATVTGSGTDVATQDGSIYLEVYTGAFEIVTA